MNTQLNKTLFKMIAGENISATTVLIKIYKQIELEKSFDKYPALCFARHIVAHGEVSRDPFAYDSLVSLLTSFSKMLSVEDYTPHYDQTISQILPFNLMNQELNVFCIKHCKSPLTQNSQLKFVISFIENIDDETIIRFDETKSVYKKKDIKEKINNILDNQIGRTQINRFNFVKIKKVIENKIEEIQIRINVDIFDVPPNGFIVREIDNLTFVLTLARIKI